MTTRSTTEIETSTASTTASTTETTTGSTTESTTLSTTETTGTTTETTTGSTTETETSTASTTGSTTESTTGSTTASETETETSTTASTTFTETSTTASTTSNAPTTTTTAGVPTTPPLCGNEGFGWSYFLNPGDNTGTSYSAFQPENFKHQPPLRSGIVSSIGGDFTARNNYGSGPGLPGSYYAVDHTAYLYTPEAGNYKIDVTWADDGLDIWVGDKAYSMWNGANVDLQGRWNANTNVPGYGTLTVNLAGGVYVPVRFFLGQAQGAGGFYFTITSPSQDVIAANQQDSPYFVRFSCDGSAPAFPIG
ncbi:hypothetical protein ACJ41O_014335 [Fusarium nematophilum]